MGHKLTAALWDLVNVCTDCYKLIHYPSENRLLSRLTLPLPVQGYALRVHYDVGRLLVSSSYDHGNRVRATT